jgi:hypothetical protein
VVNVGTVCKTARIVAIDGMVGRRGGPKKNKKLPPSVTASISAKLNDGASTTAATTNKVGTEVVQEKTILVTEPKQSHEENDDEETSGPSLRTGMRARLRFQFDHPQRVNIGQILVFREGRARGVGRVVGLFE